MIKDGRGQTLINRIRVEAVTAEPSGNEHFFKFTLTADLPARPQELRSIVTDVTGDLYTPGAEHRIVLGRLHGVRDATVFETQPRERALQFWLRALVARRQLEAVEHFRAGGDVMLGLELRVASFAMLPVPIPYAAKPTDVAAYPAIALEEVLHPVPQSEWLKLLRAAGYCDTLLLEVSFPGVPASAEWESVAGALRAAHDHGHRGHFKECVASCRDALEALAGVRGDRQAIEHALARYRGDKTQNTKLERVHIVRELTRHLTHLAHHHSEDVPNPCWGPEDARAAMALTTALVSWYAARPLDG